MKRDVNLLQSIESVQQSTFKTKKLVFLFLGMSIILLAITLLFNEKTKSKVSAAELAEKSIDLELRGDLLHESENVGGNRHENTVPLSELMDIPDFAKTRKKILTIKLMQLARGEINSFRFNLSGITNSINLSGVTSDIAKTVMLLNGIVVECQLTQMSLSFNEFEAGEYQFSAEYLFNPKETKALDCSDNINKDSAKLTLGFVNSNKKYYFGARYL